MSLWQWQEIQKVLYSGGKRRETPLIPCDNGTTIQLHNSLCIETIPSPEDTEALALHNLLFCGDNLDVLRRYFPDDSVDLVYLDPPFKSDQDYNLLFRDKGGEKSASQILAFEDTWEWSHDAEKSLTAVIERGGKLGEIMSLFRVDLGDSDMLAYLAMMAPRLVELHRVLKPTGSLYLHCDPTASHYLKILVDAIFGAVNFRNEIVWQRTNAHNAAGQYGRVHDILLFYSKTNTYCWNEIPQPYGEAQLKRYKADENGRQYTCQDLTASRPNSDSGKFEWRGTMPPVTRGWGYERNQLEAWWKAGKIKTKKNGTPRMDGLIVYLDEMRGKPLQSVWTDIPRIGNTSKERLGYPTQKPQALLERIIEASSKAGDIVLDPFCGCGTAIEAADKQMRNWLGIDITIQAMRVIRNERLKKLGYTAPKDYQVIYRPADISAAEVFAAEQPFAFQDWAVEMLNGIPTKARSGDRGIDGRLYFQDEEDGPLRQVLVSVKGGKLKATFVRELQGAVARERAAMGVLITLNEPTKQMRRDIAAGVYPCTHGTFPKTQFVTVKEILSGAALNLPPIKKMDEVKKRAVAAAESQMDLPGVI